MLLKKNLIMIMFVLFAIFLIVFSNSNLSAARNGLSLWSNNVVPSLFPFFVAVELLKHTNIVYFLSKYLDRFMKPLFNVPGCATFPLIMGLISGYPVGAKIVSDLYLDGKCTKNEAERMLTFTNNAGPLFVIGTVGTSFYGSSTFGFILLITHILSSLTVGIIFGKISKKKQISSKSKNYYNNSNIRISDLGGILGSSITSAIKSILTIGGFVTLFSVIISILNKSGILVIISNIIGTTFHIDTSLVNGFITGIIEFTNGLYKLSTVHQKNISLNLILSSFVLGFGGISVTLQVLSIISKSKLSIRKYIFAKILHGIIGALYTYLVLMIPIFNFNL